MSIIPNTLPQLSGKEVRAELIKLGVTDPVAVLAIPGYYLNSMGAVGRNDRGIYDDAMFIVSPNGVVSFNANTDPSIYRKGVASLKAGVWRYKPGLHGITFNRAGYPYPAFVQAAEVTVLRDSKGQDTGWFGINIHRGSNTGTSSLGCQTIPPKQWDGFYALLTAELKRAGQKTFPYALKERV